MRWVISFLLFFPTVSLTNTNSDDFHICFFELNNTTASDNLKGLDSGAKVHTFTPDSSNDFSKGFKQ